MDKTVLTVEQWKASEGRKSFFGFTGGVNLPEGDYTFLTVDEATLIVVGEPIKKGDYADLIPHTIRGTVIGDGILGNRGDFTEKGLNCTTKEILDVVEAGKEYAVSVRISKTSGNAYVVWDKAFMIENKPAEAQADKEVLQS